MSTETQTQKPAAVLLRMRCRNDSNGNPRRIYRLESDFKAGVSTGPYPGDGYFKRVLYAEEGYLGRTAARRLMEAAGIDPAAVADLGDVDLSPADYRQILKSDDLVNVHGLENPTAGVRWND